MEKDIEIITKGRKDPKLIKVIGESGYFEDNSGYYLEHRHFPGAFILDKTLNKMVLKGDITNEELVIRFKMAEADYHHLDSDRKKLLKLLDRKLLGCGGDDYGD